MAYSTPSTPTSADSTAWPLPESREMAHRKQCASNLGAAPPRVCVVEQPWPGLGGSFLPSRSASFREPKPVIAARDATAAGRIPVAARTSLAWFCREQAPNLRNCLHNLSPVRIVRQPFLLFISRNS
jgi:hypothetical protein